MHLNKSLRAALTGTAAIAGLCAAQDASAATTTGTLAVSATVVNNCVFTTNPLAFGNYDPAVVNAAGGTALTGNGSLVVTCTTNDSITVDFDAGGNPAGSSTALVPLRQMSDGASDLLGYTLFWPTTLVAGTASTTPWGTGTGSSYVFTATGVAQTINVWGSVAKGQNVPAGSYADTVNVTVNY
jgi:spore coat protein U-like protein